MRRYSTLVLLAQATHAFHLLTPHHRAAPHCAARGACVLQLGGLFDAFKSPTEQALAQARKDLTAAQREEAEATDEWAMVQKKFAMDLLKGRNPEFVEAQKRAKVAKAAPRMYLEQMWI